MLRHFLDSVKNPPREFTPILFWFFNDEPDEENILAHNGRLEELEGLFQGKEYATTRLYHKLIDGASRDE